jgi:hypothetical protein
MFHFLTVKPLQFAYTCWTIEKYGFDLRLGRAVFPSDSTQTGAGPVSLIFSGRWLLLSKG